VTDELLYGYDRDRNGAADDPRRSRAARGSRRLAGDSTADERGLAPFVTAATVERNADRKGRARVNIGDAAAGAAGPAPAGAPPARRAGRHGARQLRARADRRPGKSRHRPAPRHRPGAAGQPGAPGGPACGRRRGDGRDALREVLRTPLQRRVERGPRPRRAAAGRSATCSTSRLKAGLTQDELRDVFDRLTTVDGKVIVGRVNVNTAPREVLACLPGLDASDADALVAGGVRRAGRRRVGARGADARAVARVRSLDHRPVVPVFRRRRGRQQRRPRVPPRADRRRRPAEPAGHCLPKRPDVAGLAARRRAPHALRSGQRPQGSGRTTRSRSR
jgi:hypothetical protein